MFETLERMPLEEIQGRHERCRALLALYAPRAGGLMAFTKTNLYWLSGTLVPGVFWLPLEGEPVLFLRRGAERAGLESPMANVVRFRSYRDIPGLAAEVGSPLSKIVAAEKGGLPWNLAESLQKNLPQTDFVPGDGVLARARGVKSERELAIMRLAGTRHDQALRVRVPELVRPGMNERELSHLVWQAFFELGHMGHMRMNSFGEEIFLGHVAAGDSGNYPSVFDGPLGLRGEHPALPFMGYRGKIWQKGEPLALDCGFSLEGYATDKTQVLWAGEAATIPEKARRGHDFCVRTQAWLAENLKPGAIPSELYRHCMASAESEGLSEGFMALAPNTVKFVGHGIGLAIDGWPVIAEGFEEPLEENQVVAIEPKFGIAGLGMVGVENTFVVTPGGGECITGRDYDIICVP